MLRLIQMAILVLIFNVLILHAKSDAMVESTWLLSVDGDGNEVCPAVPPSWEENVVGFINCGTLCSIQNGCLLFTYDDSTSNCQQFNSIPTSFVRSESCRSNMLTVNFNDGNCSNQDTANASIASASNQVNTVSLIRPSCCSLPFTFNGQLYYGCIEKSSTSTLECPVDYTSWANCLGGSDYRAKYVESVASFPAVGYDFPILSIHSWIVIHQKLPQTVVLFERGWKGYRNGFGNFKDSFWLGNEKVYLMTSSGSWKLRVEVQANASLKWYSAEYSSFRLSNELSKYVLNVSGYYWGDAGGDSFSTASNGGSWSANGMKFTTYDSDNDQFSGGNCAITNLGGWWYNNCGTATLTSRPQDAIWEGLTAYGTDWYVSASRMMIKPA